MKTLNNICNRLKKNNFLNAIFVLSSGSIWAQGIVFLCSLIITRLYLPADIGFFTFILSIINIFSGVINGRYEISIVSASSRSEIKGLIQLSFLVAVIGSICVTLGFYLYLLLWGKDRSLLALIWVCFFLLLISGVVNILNAYNNRAEEYRIMAKVYVIRSVLQNVIIIGCGIFHWGIWGLLLGQFCGQLAGLKKQSSSLLKSGIKIFTPDRRAIQYAFWKHSRQLTYSAPATLINALAYSAISICIGNTYGMTMLGLYGISLRVLGLPLAVFSSNIARVHYRDAVKEIAAVQNYFHCTVKTLMLALAGVVPFTIVLMVCSPMLFAIIFGEEWREAGIYVRILAPMFGIRFLVGTVGYGFILASRQLFELFFQILLFGALIGGSLLVRPCNWNISVFLFYISVVYSGIYLLELLTILFMSKRRYLKK